MEDCASSVQVPVQPDTTTTRSGSEAAFHALRDLQEKVARLEQERNRVLEVLTQFRTASIREINELKANYDAELSSQRARGNSLVKQIDDVSNQKEQFKDMLHRTKELFEDLRNRMLSTTRVADDLRDRLNRSQQENMRLRESGAFSQQAIVNEEQVNAEKTIELERKIEELKAQVMPESNQRSKDRYWGKKKADALHLQHLEKKLEKLIESNKTSDLEKRLESVQKQLIAEGRKREQLEAQYGNIQKVLYEYSRSNRDGQSVAYSRPSAQFSDAFPTSKTGEINVESHGDSDSEPQVKIKLKRKEVKTIKRTLKPSKKLSWLPSSPLKNTRSQSASRAKRIANKKLKRRVRPASCRSRSKDTSKSQSSLTFREDDESYENLIEKLKNTYTDGAIPFMPTATKRSFAITSNVQEKLSMRPDKLSECPTKRGRSKKRSTNEIDASTALKLVDQAIEHIQTHLASLEIRSKSIHDKMKAVKASKQKISSKTLQKELIEIVDQVKTAASRLDKLERKRATIRQSDVCMGSKRFPSPEAKHIYQRKIRLLRFLDRFKREVFPHEDITMVDAK